MNSRIGDKEKLKNILKAVAMIGALSLALPNALAHETQKPYQAGEHRVSTNPHLAKAATLVASLAKKVSPDLEYTVTYTDIATIEERAHAKSNIRDKGCQVVFNNGVTNLPAIKRLKEYTGWDDDQLAILLVAHELQHCITSDDVRRAAHSKQALSERAANALHTFVWGTRVAEKVAKNPSDKDAVTHLEQTGWDDVFGAANESISDISALLMIQKLSDKGLTVEAVEGFKKWRLEQLGNDIISRHDTTPALDHYAKMLKVNAITDDAVSPEDIAETAYKIVGSVKPINEYTTFTAEDLVKARNAYMSSSTTLESFSL